MGVIGQSVGEAAVSLSQEHLNFPLAQQHDDGSEGSSIGGSK